MVISKVWRETPLHLLYGNPVRLCVFCILFVSARHNRNLFKNENSVRKLPQRMEIGKNMCEWRCEECETVFPPPK